MKILAIDSSGLIASAALATEDAVLAEYTTNYKKTHSQTLLPMIDEIVKMTETELSELDAIAVTAGPGSFTGLRIGSATAKGLGQALSKPLIAVPTTEALAWNFCGAEAVICPLMDARRSQVYTGLYRWNKETGAMDCLFAQEAMAVEDIIAEVNRLGCPVIYLGDGADAYRTVLSEKTEVAFSFAPVHMSKQRAASLAACAFVYAKEGKTQTAAEFVPTYLRKSQAEREREEKERAEQA
ncbi:MAG: tRNA (adenosine(37)-N6)-threonylcarbamoyltransferase complex dimerization subunit type 1 TsaB [Lachnospiraceae bacterium]|nr:tRNA (adenosine(37)-N6)-threonylcarbamoyltransferase complex dimerization subunit type 1 TsaB [Lachnospiraceae bacterium]